LLNCLLAVLQHFYPIPVSCSHHSWPHTAFICMSAYCDRYQPSSLGLRIAVHVEGRTFMLGAEPKIRIPESALFKAGALLDETRSLVSECACSSDSQAVVRRTLSSPPPILFFLA
jgi:hypothetical protein